ncbi:MAG: CRTAC1 family protein, partial [Acidobacteriota bacterium]
EGWGVGCAVGDYDDDGLLDLLVTNFSHETNNAYLNHGQGIFVDAVGEVNMHMPSWFYLGWGTRLTDLDNDGDEDLFVANGHVYPGVDETNLRTRYHQPNQVFWNGGDGQLAEGAFPVEDAMQEVASSRAAAFGDIDEDGDVDVVVVNIDAPPSLLQNRRPAGEDGNWIAFRLVGAESNRDAVGTRLILTAGSTKQVKEVHPSGSFLSSNDVRVHFGLAEHKKVGLLVVRWPGGLEETLRELEANQLWTLVEGRNGPPPGLPPARPSRQAR